ncbi:P-loop containing nucleoside triphosphate hydrolase protein [Hyaloraphidium curvatum]|nr:P-loop containing nucleoside triphosphate hydrolase protein [Hyaloraphidium curvatum]
MVVVLFAVVLGQLLFVYTDPDPEDVTAGANFWSLIVFNVAALEGVAFYAKVLCFELAGERLTMRVRKRAFDAALAHELAWFSMQEHSPAQVMRALSAEAPKIRGAATGAWGNLVGFLSTAIGGFVWAMLCGWKLALVAWALVPAVAILGAVERYFSGGAGKVLSSGVAAADGLVAEAVDAWRTVAAYGLEDKVLARYKASLKDVSESTELGRGIAAAAHGLAQGVLYFFQALFWWYAASLLRPFEYSLLNIAIIWALAAFCGTASGQLPAVGDVLEASRRALATVALIMAPSPPQPEGRRYMGEAAAPSGSLEIADLAYTDPDTGADVLRGFALSLHPGEHVAVVGATHAERRALHALVLGLYEPSYGRIVLDGVDVRDWDGRFMRARVTALWDRDAPVFSGTAADNVAYGMPDATPESIMAAAGAAGVHDAIQAVGGYETVLGPGGKELDGESAERMALARALIRDPELLLVDDPAEPSSDPALARLLLAAADRRTVLRTTDDLPSVVGCNRIFVVRQGAVVEEGTHAELLEHHGDYFRMWNAATH